ncbi:carboxymuconolactone decarboxylase family protein [Francisella marina]|uniref:carboxymuconolactone decarboxylase family protein n=1 Tax=Francisella marina TaxID=2249302 RepID=UPI0011EEA905|nr:carboxymuconolactone decarboxylase family protein [Francisella marina]QEO59620.1 carboxymuconolactone decarboxylase [Francisella marina]
MVLIEIKYKKGLDIVDQYRQSHIDYLARFYEKEVILASGPYNNREGGFIISVMDLKSAKDYVENDPFYINEIGDFDIKDFIPTKSSKGFGHLIDNNDFSKDGKELFNQLHGKHAGEELIKALSKIAPDFSKLTFDFAFESIFARDTEMSMLTKELITIAVCCAIGDCQAQVQSHLEAAINLGASKDMIVETLLLVTPFAGFPRVANSLLSIKI